MKLVKAMATVAGLTGLSRIAGFVRDVLTAAVLGAGPVGDAFFVALKLPNFFRRVTAEGAFSVSFVPLYTKTLEKEGKKKADLFASNAFMVMLCGLSVFTLVAIMAMPLVMYIIAPGFSQGDIRYDLAVEMSRITFPYLLLMSLAALLGGVLNAIDRFAPFAFAPTLFNLSLVAGLLLTDFFETPGHAMAWGILVAGVLQLGFLWVCAARAGIKLKLGRPKMDLKVKKVLKLMGPGVIGAGVVHINLFADLFIGSFLATGSISYLYYADRLNQLPLGMVGIAVGTALLPMLSRAIAKKDMKEARDLFNRAMEYCLLLALPAGVALAVIPLSIVTVLFERGAFTAADSLTTAHVLMGYAVGLPAYIATKVFATTYWARHDTTTPVRVAVIATVFNILASLVFIWFIGVAGIALATGLAGWVQFAFFMREMKKDKVMAFDKRFVRHFNKIAASSCVMGIVLLILSTVLQGWLLEGHGLVKVLALGVLIGGGGLAYGAMILGTRAIEIKDVKKYLLRRI